jgi:hypothetical protein
MLELAQTVQLHGAEEELYNIRARLFSGSGLEQVEVTKFLICIKCHPLHINDFFMCITCLTLTI